MKKTLALLLGSALAACAADMTVATLYDSQLKLAEGEVVSLAEAMPESAYHFAPTQGAFTKVRTFGEQVKHIATVMYMAAAASAKEKPPIDLGSDENGPVSIQSKAQILQYLKDAFAYGHKSHGETDGGESTGTGARSLPRDAADGAGRHRQPHHLALLRPLRADGGLRSHEQRDSAGERPASGTGAGEEKEVERETVERHPGDCGPRTFRFHFQRFRR